MEALLRDLRFALRMLRKNPGLILAAILTLALAIGANTAMFTVTSALLLRLFPYSDPQQLVTIQVKAQTEDRPGTLLRYELMRDHAKSFEIAAWANDNFNLTGRGEPLQVPVARVTANFFSLLGVKPELGRAFTEDVGIVPASVQFPFVGEADIWTPRYFELTLMSAQRQHELGIRLALGAQRTDVLLLVLKQGLLLAVAGVAIGLIAALLLTNLMVSMLYHVSARDLLTFALTPLIFLAIALLASYLPARRTAKLEPMETLRVS
jgi:hypothetical protein